MIQLSKYSNIDVDTLRDKPIETRFDIMLSFIKDIENKKKQAQKQKMNG